VVPTFTVTSLGLNWMFFMSIVTVLPLGAAVPPEVELELVVVAGVELELDDEDELLELPQPAAARATTANRSNGIRFM
jgi:hypothetical protein